VSARLQIRLLETFVAIVEGGTLTAAANRLYKTQGAVSHDLKLLERQLGTSVIDRSGQRVRLTPAGAALLPHAQEVLLRIADIEAAISRVKGGEGDVIRVGSLASVCSRVLDYLAEYRERAIGDARFAVTTGLHKTLVDQLSAGTLDLAITEPELDEQLVGIDLGSEPHVVVFRRDDDLADRDKIAPEDVESRPLIAFIRELGSSRFAEQFFAPSSRYPRTVFEVDDYRLMLQLIRRGAGYGLLPVSSLAHETDLVGVPPSFPLERRLVILRNANRVLSPGIRELCRYLSERWREQDVFEYELTSATSGAA
jgi:DNA-binding transcriptional LysR family regulator